VGWLTPARRFEAEILDRPDNPRAALEAALRDLRWVNRLLGGRRALFAALDPFLDAVPRGEGLLVLDVGTGSGDLPVAMVERARGRARRLEVVAVERDPSSASIARRETGAHPEIHVVRADARRLPFAPGSFDLVTASLFLHHFRPAEAAELLASFRRLARRAVLVNDLRRHLVPWGFIALAARATFRHPILVHDGPLSVLRGFTPEELRDAGGEAARVDRKWPYRLVMVLPGEAR
jgi:SAM-dependent methyltransferase